MTQREKWPLLSSDFLKPRRIALLASIAGVCIAALVADGDVNGPKTLGWIAPAAAAEAAQPGGFADLVARVKPAVVSVRVRVDNTAQMNSLGNDASPFQQGSPLDQFFRQFGFRDTPQ